MPDHEFLLERFDTPLGPVLLATDEDGCLRSLDWEDFSDRMNQLLRLHYGSYRLKPTDPVSGARRALEAYFAGDLAAIAGLPVRTSGTGFQNEVWAALRTIPAGETTTYAKLAALVGRPRAVRATGAANGANPVSIVVPCHRVIGSNGTLTGYGGGLERKRWLLQHERG